MGKPGCGAREMKASWSSAGRPRRRPDALLGDKSYDYTSNRNALRERGRVMKAAE
ncbi:hypothetical protein [Streptomyces cyaneofuscatus]|uniref:hypothetical protein n=1 Tax=Streptomyces cyaneofuscatus TaxID=66883 RepID=UPI0038085723